MNKLIEKQKHFLKLLKADGYTFEQLTDAYNRGYIDDEVYKYGLEIYGFSEISTSNDVVKNES